MYRSRQNILARRQQEIDGIYAAADADRASASEMKEEYTQRMASARDEADRLVRSAVDEANRKGDEILGDARSQASQERLKAFTELKRELSGMAVDIAEKMVGREIGDADQDALVEDFLRNAGDDK